jgi:hypothetical protein
MDYTDYHSTGTSSSESLSIPNLDSSFSRPRSSEVSKESMDQLTAATASIKLDSLFDSNPYEKAEEDIIGIKHCNESDDNDSDDDIAVRRRW